MSDYENLGFEINVGEKSYNTAVSRLDKIIEKLEYIHKLEGKKLPQKGGSSTPNVGDPKEEKQVKKNTKALGSYLAKLTSVVVVARKFARFIGGAIKESANYIENLNLFAVAYGETYQQQLDWALGIAEAYGLANNEVIKFAGTFRELSTSLGLVGETADLVSKTVTNLGYDLSALFNTTVEQAMEKLQSGVFSGNVRPLRAYGIDISQNQIDALFETNQALAQLGVNARNLSQSDKVLARLIITLQSGKDSFGTMAREINNLQSQFRIFQGSIANFKLAIGDLIEKPLSKVMVLVNAVVIALTNVIRTFVPLRTEDKNPITGIAEGAENANEELDELQGKLAGFDKFNVLQSSGKNSNLSVTEELNKLLEQQAGIYENQLSQALKDMNNEATELAKKLEGLVLIGTSFLILFSISKIGGVVTSLKKLNGALSMSSILLSTGIIFFIYEAVKAFKEGEYWIGALSSVIATGLVVSWVLLNKEMIKTIGLKITKWIQALIVDFKKLEFGASGLLYTFGILALGISTFFMSFNDMSEVERAIGIFGALAGAIAGVAIAFHATHNWAKALMVGGMVAGGILTVAGTMSQIQGFEKGGYSNANLIMTHENGKREAIMKQGKSNVIMNDMQMTDIMEVSVAKGVYSALSARSDLNGGSTIEQPIIVKIGEQEVFTAVKKTAKKQGLGFANI